MPDDFENNEDFDDYRKEIDESAEYDETKKQQLLKEMHDIAQNKKSVKIRKIDAFSSAAKESADLDNEPYLPAADTGRKMHRNMLPMIKKWGSSAAAVVLVIALFLFMLPLFHSSRLKNAQVSGDSQLSGISDTLPNGQTAKPSSELSSDSSSETFKTQDSGDSNSNTVDSNTGESNSGADNSNPGLTTTVSHSAAVPGQTTTTVPGQTTPNQGNMTTVTQHTGTHYDPTSETSALTLPSAHSYPIPQDLLDSDDPYDMLRGVNSNYFSVPDSKMLQLFNKISRLSDMMDVGNTYCDMSYNIAGTGEKNLSYNAMFAADSTVSGGECYMILENYDTNRLELRRIHLWNYTIYTVLAQKPLPSDCSYESTHEKWSSYFPPNCYPTLPFPMYDQNGNFTADPWH